LREQFIHGGADDLNLMAASLWVVVFDGYFDEYFLRIRFTGYSTQTRRRTGTGAILQAAP
jgi:hypothetical protein